MHRTGHLKVTSGDKPFTYTVTLDGEDISRLVSGLTIEYGPGSLPRAELDVIAVETECEGNPDLHLKPGTAELLERFGWTPPGSPGLRVFTAEDVETTAQALWVYWHRNTRWETEGWSAQSAYEQQAYRDKARAALRSLGTVPDDSTFATAKLSDVVHVPQSVTEATPADPTAWRHQPGSTPRPTDGE